MTKLFIRIMLLVAFFAFSEFIFSLDNIFLKAGFGVGYDSNLLFSFPQYNTELYLIKFGGYGKWGSDGVQFIAHVNSDSEVYNVYYNIKAGLGGDIVLQPTDEVYIQGGISYLYMMDISETLLGNIEYRQDIGEYFTFKSLYGIENSTGINGVTNESFLLNSFSAGVEFDLTSLIEAEVNLNDTFISYFRIFVDGKGLNNNGLKALLLLTFTPDYNCSIRIGGGYSYYDTFNTNLCIFSDTNSIYLYNTANQYRFLASLNYEWTPNFKTTLSAETSLVSLVYHPVTEEVYNFMIQADYYFNSSWKIEIPLFYTLKNSTLLASFDRWRVATVVYYLF